jgi:hypothetical protein
MRGSDAPGAKGCRPQQALNRALAQKCHLHSPTQHRLPSHKHILQVHEQTKLTGSLFACSCDIFPFTGPQRIWSLSAPNAFRSTNTRCTELTNSTFSRVPVSIAVALLGFCLGFMPFGQRERQCCAICATCPRDCERELVTWNDEPCTVCHNAAMMLA